MLLATREGQPFLIANGVQTLSAATHSLAGEAAALRACGIDLLRVSPQAEHTAQTLAVLRSCIDGERPAQEVRAALAALAPGALCRGFWDGRAGMEAVP